MITPVLPPGEKSSSNIGIGEKFRGLRLICESVSLLSLSKQEIRHFLKNPDLVPVALCMGLSTPISRGETALAMRIIKDYVHNQPARFFGCDSYIKELIIWFIGQSKGLVQEISLQIPSDVPKKIGCVGQTSFGQMVVCSVDNMLDQKAKLPFHFLMSGLGVPLNLRCECGALETADMRLSYSPYPKRPRQLLWKDALKAITGKGLRK
jgi:hypothetical protein